MKILVYGAGVIGCNLAKMFYKSIKDVTILARGNKYLEYKENGIIFENEVFHFKKRYHIKTINCLTRHDHYDIIFVCLQFSQIEKIVDILNNNNSKNIVLVGNNFEIEKYQSLLINKNLMFGFYYTAGRKENNKIVSINMKKMIIGPYKNNEFLIENVFDNSKIKVLKEDRIDDWLKSHAAFILPLVFSCYINNGKLKTLLKDKEYIDHLLNAFIETFNVLKANGYKILPKGDEEFVRNKKKCLSYIKLMYKTFIGKIVLVDHALSATNEMKELAYAFDRLKQKCDVKTPNYDYLEKYLMNYGG